MTHSCSTLLCICMQTCAKKLKRLCKRLMSRRLIKKPALQFEYIATIMPRRNSIADLEITISDDLPFEAHINHRHRHRGMGWSTSPHFYSSIVSFAVSGGDYSPASKKFFKVRCASHNYPSLCESESVPLTLTHLFLKLGSVFVYCFVGFYIYMYQAFTTLCTGPIVEYNSVVWNAGFVYLIDLHESVQRNFTNHIYHPNRL
jgi:hypothetical protein